MKSKKRFVAIGSMALCAALSLGAVGCGHEHAYEWEETTPATCTTEGVETGTCATDNDKQTRPIPVNPNAHTYGAWVVTEPTMTEEGEAVKTCTNSAEHTVSVTLPVLTSSDYKVEVTKQPMLGVEGEGTYTFSHAQGNITFTAPVAAKTYANVAEAIEAAQDSKALVGKTERKNVSYEEDEAGKQVEKVTYSLISEVGDKYLHVVDDYRDLYFDFDDEGNFTHVVQSVYDSWDKVTNYSIPMETKEELAKYKDGARFALTGTFPMDGDYAAYGAEGLLEMLYAFATDDADTALVNGGYAETFTAADSLAQGTMSFGRFDKVSYDKYDYTTWEVVGYNVTETFYETEVTFTMNAYSMLETLEVTTVSYSYSYSTKTDGTPYEEGETIDSPFSADENGVYSVDKTKFAEDYVPYEYAYSYKQTAAADIETKPVNPIDYDKATVKSFEIYNGNTKIENGATVTWTTESGLNLDVKGITPETAEEFLGLNPVSIYLKEGNEETKLGYSTEILGSYSSYDKQIFLRSRNKVEDATIVVRCGETEISFKLVINEAAPAQFSTNVTVYSEANDNWASKLDNKATIYQGQELAFSVEALPPQYENYAVDGSYTATVSGGATITDGENGTKVFKATAAGEYTITITSTVNNFVTATITVTVNEVPNLEEALTGAYENKVNEATVTFGENKTVTVAFADKTETLTWTLADNKLTTTHASGAEAGYKLVLNDNYNLVLTYPDAGNVTQRILLVKAGTVNPADALKGTSWIGASTQMMGGENKIVFNADGSTGAYITTNGGEAKVEFSYVLTNNGSDYSIAFTQIGEATSGAQLFFNCEAASAGSTVVITDGKVTSLTIAFTDNFGGGAMKMNQVGGSEEPDPGPVEGGDFVFGTEKVVNVEGYALNEFKLVIAEDGTYEFYIDFDKSSPLMSMANEVIFEIYGQEDMWNPIKSGSVTFMSPSTKMALEAGTYTLNINVAASGSGSAAVTVSKSSQGGGDDEPVEDDGTIVIGTEKEIEVEGYGNKEVTFTVTESGTYVISIDFYNAIGMNEYTVMVFGAGSWIPVLDETTLSADHNVAEVTLAAGTYTFYIATEATVDSIVPVTISPKA